MNNQNKPFRRPQATPEQIEFFKGKGDLSLFLTNPKETYDTFIDHWDTFALFHDESVMKLIKVACYKTHQFGPKPTDLQLQLYDVLTKQLLNDDNMNIMQAQDLDTMWLLYYVTKNKAFPNQIKKISTCARTNFLVRAAASWSYNSHVQQNLLI